MEITDVRSTIYRPRFLELEIRGILLNALAFTNGCQKEAAQLLGLSSRMMGYNMEKYGIPTAGKAHRHRSR